MKTTAMILTIALMIISSSIKADECLIKSQQEAEILAGAIITYTYSPDSTNPHLNMEYPIDNIATVQNSSGCWGIKAYVSGIGHFIIGQGTIYPQDGEKTLQELLVNQVYGGTPSCPTPTPIELSLPTISPQMKSELSMLFTIFWWGTISTGITAWSAGRIIKFIWHNGQSSW